MALREKYFGEGDGSFFLEPSLKCKYRILRGVEGEKNLKFNRGEGRSVYYVGLKKPSDPPKKRGR